MFKRPVLWLIILGLLALEAGCIAAQNGTAKTGIIDFAALYGSARSVHNGGAPDYDPSTIQGVDRIHATHPIPASRVDRLHPPFEVLLFLTFAPLPYLSAYYAWSACSLALLWLVPLALWRYIPRLHAEFEVIAVLYGLFFPAIVCLLEGQDSILLLLLMSLSFISLAKGQNFRAGVFLALGLFKFHLVLPLVATWIVARNWRAVAGFVSGFFALLVTTFAVVGVHTTLSYIPFVMHFSQHISTNVSEKTSMMPNLRGLVAALLGSVAGASVQSWIVVALSAVVFAMLLVWSYRWRNQPVTLQVSIALTFTSLLSYHYYVHNSIILVLPLFLMANEFASPGADARLRRSFTAIAIAICVTFIIASVGIVLLEHAMPVIAVESLLMAAILFAVPYTAKSAASAPGLAKTANPSVS
jgi:hypothetical protein